MLEELDGGYEMLDGGEAGGSRRFGGIFFRKTKIFFLKYSDYRL